MSDRQPATRVLVLSEIDGLLPALQALCRPGEAEFTHRSLSGVGGEELSSAEVIVADPPTFSSCADRASSLRWLQSTFAGCDALMKESAARHYTVTRLAGVFGPAMAEYVMLHVLALERKYRLNLERQRSRTWGSSGSVAQKSYRLLSTLTLGVLGSGDIGMEVARRASQFGMRVVVCKRDTSSAVPEHVDKVYGPADVKEFLGVVDYFVNLLPSTPQTRGLLGGDTLLSCQKASLINVGRGDVTDEPSILAALEAGALAHAVLDVFPVEPLPEDSRLWSHPDVTISPHNSAESFPEDVARAFAENLRRYRAGQPLQHVFQWEKGY